MEILDQGLDILDFIGGLTLFVGALVTIWQILTGRLTSRHLFEHRRL